jgi:hypothetical protein
MWCGRGLVQEAAAAAAAKLGRSFILSQAEQIRQHHERQNFESHGKMNVICC